VLIWATLIYTVLIASLMVSRLPVFSGKRFGTRVSSELVGPLIVFVVLFIALLIAYPWAILTAGTLAYLAALPFGWLSFRGYQRLAQRSEAAPQPAPTLRPTVLTASPIPPSEQEDRPPRLN
jgi:CDP-diacylglycerol--serine O-phosphatidyltransferase